MASLEKPPVVTSTIKWRFPEMHPEGRKYVLIALTVTLLCTWMISNVLFWPLLAVTAWVVAFVLTVIGDRGAAVGAALASGVGLSIAMAFVGARWITTQDWPLW